MAKTNSASVNAVVRNAYIIILLANLINIRAIYRSFFYWGDKMAKLAPYYVHSNYDLWESQSVKQFEAAKVSKLIDDLKKELNNNINRLYNLEMMFYNNLGITSGNADDRFNQLLPFLTGEKGQQEINAGTVWNTLYNHFYNDNQFYIDWANKIISKVNQNPQVGLSIQCKRALKEQLYALAKTIYDTKDLEKVNTIIIDSIESSTVVFKLPTLENFQSGNIDMKGIVQNLMGGLGEIKSLNQLSQVAEDIGSEYIKNTFSNYSITNTGQLTFKNNGKSKELSADIVFEFIAKNQKVKQFGWQIKNYNLSKEGYKKKIKIASYKTENWLKSYNDLTQDGFMTKEQFDAITYTLVNYLWFKNYGDLSHRSKKNLEPQKRAVNRNYIEVVKYIKQIFGMLSISNAIKDLNKTITPEGDIIGTVNLVSNGKQKAMNIPAVFWSISGKGFFPTRWVLNNIILWLDDLKSKTFTPLQISIKYTGEAKISTPWELLISKSEATKNGLKRPPRYSAGVVSAGNKVGEALAQSIQIEQNLAILKNQINQISGLSGLVN